jgi:anion-transporting  ArsA/GET3 family ATPase
MTAGVGAVTNTMAKIVGAQVLKDLQTFVAALDTLFGGFRNRAQRTFELLQTRETAFLVVASPEADAMREAAYFVERLDAERMPLAGLVVNRATAALDGLSAEQAIAGAERLESADGATSTAATTAGVLRLHADRMQRVERERRMQQRFQAAHPHVSTVVVPALPSDVHDLDGLRRVGDLLAG